jgi:transcriptional regulator with XRE-family HTH domain
METTNEKLRQEFSVRLKKELERLGLPLSSPTRIAAEFNTKYPGSKVAAQTVRKWLFAEAIPTQAKLVALAEWLEVSEQWLRFGTGRRRAGKATDATLNAPERGVVVVGKNQAAVVPVVELLAKLSPKNIRLVENIIRCILASQVEDE